MVVTHCAFLHNIHLMFFIDTQKHMDMGACTPYTHTMEYSQVERHRFLIPTCKGSNPFTPIYTQYYSNTHTILLQYYSNTHPIPQKKHLFHTHHNFLWHTPQEPPYTHTSSAKNLHPHITNQKHGHALATQGTFCASLVLYMRFLEKVKPLHHVC